jgi:hypothetical protein
MLSLETETGSDILGFQAGILVEDFRLRFTRAQEFQNGLHSDALAPNGGLAIANLGFDSDKSSGLRCS